jgi:AcrR family transcriptional regulator
MPAHGPTPACPTAAQPLGWQARKSASTRLQIVEATLRCFIDLGYFRTTTALIASNAGLSRGAMLHHFPTRADVVRAAVEHLHTKRLKAFRTAVESLPSGTNRLHGTLEAYWEQSNHPMYAVFLELAVAARTDSELAAILAPAEAAFERELRRTAMDLFPEWRNLGENFDLGFDLLVSVMDGCAVRFLRHRDAAPNRRVLRFLEARLDELARPPGGRANTW